MLSRAISHSREELAKLITAVEILEDKVKIQEYKKKESKRSFDGIQNLDHLQKTICGLLNDVQNQENQIRNALNDMKQTINHYEFHKTSNVKKIQEIPGTSLRNNFSTASLPYHWWNRSMPCLSILERQISLSRSQDSLTETFQICYFTPKKKKKSISKMSNSRNSGYCIWLPYNKTGEVYCFGV